MAGLLSKDLVKVSGDSGLFRLLIAPEVEVGLRNTDYKLTKRRNRKIHR
jgi:hypothetical protein